ncbi:uncharacterized protein LOC121864640 [Homarus americanus]|uniref:uncharacterized protein LOC121864640 n=1 Tax=Homarus americanus TaxID=6706 RepID=UPI001C493337|nr:uncharacterized protein LOC121864640 [Homarus americanus]
MKLNNRGLQVTLKDNSGDIVTSLDSAGPALWHLQCQMMLLSGVQDEIIGSRRGTQLILPHVNNSLPRDLTSANPGQHRCRDVATTQHYFSGNISRTNWTDSSSPSPRNIKSDMFDIQPRKKRSCRELTHQVPV